MTGQLLGFVAVVALIFALTVATIRVARRHKISFDPVPFQQSTHVTVMRQGDDY